MNDSKVIVANLPTSIDEDKIDFIFGSKKFNGGPISNITEQESPDKSTRCFIIEFESPQVAENLVKHGQFNFQGVTYNPKKMSEAASSITAYKSENLKTIVIGNIDEKFSEILLLFLENKSKFCGGEIRTHVYLADENKILVTFEDPNAADRVVNYGKFKVASKEFIARLYEDSNSEPYIKKPEAKKPKTDPDTTPKKVKSEIQKQDESLMEIDAINDGLRNLKLKIDINEKEEAIPEKKIRLYTGLLVGADEFKLEISKFSDCLIVNVDTNFDIDLENVSKKLYKTPKLSEHFVTIISPLDANSTDTIIVEFKETNQWDKEEIKLYFNNEKKSGGGEIANIEARTNSFIVQFNDIQTAKRVMSRLHEGLIIKPYNRSAEKPLVVKKEANKFPYSCIATHEGYFKEFKNELNSIGAKMVINGNEIKIELKNEMQLKWLNSYEERFKSYEWQINGDQVEQLKNRIQKPYVNVDFIKLTISDKVLKIEGFCEILDAEKQRIEAFIKEIVVPVNKDKIVEEELDKLETHACSLLFKEKFIADMSQKYPKLMVNIIKEKGVVKFKGEISQVLLAQQKASSIIQMIKTQKIELSESKERFFNLNRQFVDEYFSGYKLKCEFEVRGNTLYVFALSQLELDKAEQAVANSFIVVKHKIDEDSAELLDGAFGDFIREQKAELEKSNEQQGILFLISKVNSCVDLVGEKFLVERMAKNVADFFECNTIYNFEPEKFAKIDLQYFKIVKEKEISDTFNQLKIEFKHSMKYDLEDDVLTIKSTKRAREKFVSKLNELIKNKKQDCYEITENSKFAFLKKEETKVRVSLDNIERTTKCVIQMKKDESAKISEIKDAEQSDTIDHNVFFETKFNEFISFYVIDQALEDFKNVNVVVTAVGTGLEPFNISSKRIISRLSEKELRETFTKFRQSNGFFESDVFMSNGYDSHNVMRVAHACINAFKFNKLNWQECIIRILKAVNSEGFKSVAIPLLLSENIRNDWEDIATCTIKTTIEYFVKNEKRTRINSVFFVDPFKKNCNFIEQCISKELKQLATTATTTAAAATVKAAQVVQNNKKEANDSSNANYEIKIEVGSILDDKFKCDAIVNTTSFDLKLQNGIVSKLLLAKAGQGIQDELNQNYPNGLNDDLVAISTGGNLPSTKNIMHISLFQWKSNDQNVEKRFKSTIDTIMSEADKLKCKSVGIPAIGTGNLQYPRDICAEWMFTTVKEYFKAHPKSNVMRVLFILFDKDQATIDAFKNYENKSEISDVADVEDYEVPARKDFADYKQKDPTSLSMNFGDILFNVYVGDILVSQQEVLVNPTAIDLNMNGVIARLILSKANMELKTELNAIPKLNDDGVSWTNGGNTGFKAILHLDVGKRTKDAVYAALSNANSKRYSSIVLPVIGTGYRKSDPSDSVKDIVGAVVKFNESKDAKDSSLKEIHVCVYSLQKDILHIFENEMQKLENKNKNVFKWVVDYFRGNNQQRTLNYNFDGKAASASVSGKRALMTLLLFSDSQRRIDEAKKQINDIFENEKNTDTFQNEHLKFLDGKVIRSVCQSFDLNVTFELNLDRIRLSGFNFNIYECKTKLLEIINEYLSQQRSKAEAQIVAKDVQWQYMPSNSDSWKNYNIYINEKTEKAFQKKDKWVIFDDENGEKCTIELEKDKMVEKDHKGNFKHVVRRVDLAATMITFPLPTNWDANKKCDLIALAPTNEEYKDVYNKFLKGGMNGKFTAVISIERVQQERLYFQYQVHKKAFKEEGKSDERDLWHGSLGDSIENIWTTGFNRSYCGRNATVYGKGVYFARDSSYSHAYTNLGQNRGMVGSFGKYSNTHGHIFLSKVLVGRYEVGNGATESKNLPRLTDGKVVDSTVDNKATPGIFVIYHDAQAYPEYLITYH